jgi:hypothetical protein
MHLPITFMFPGTYTHDSFWVGQLACLQFLGPGISTSKHFTAYVVVVVEVVDVEVDVVDVVVIVEGRLTSVGAVVVVFSGGLDLTTEGLVESPTVVVVEDSGGLNSASLPQ